MAWQIPETHPICAFIVLNAPFAIAKGRIAGRSPSYANFLLLLAAGHMDQFLPKPVPFPVNPGRSVCNLSLCSRTNLFNPIERKNKCKKTYFLFLPTCRSTPTYLKFFQSLPTTFILTRLFRFPKFKIKLPPPNKFFTKNFTRQIHMRSRHLETNLIF